MEIVQAIKKLNSISQTRLNFRRRPFVYNFARNFGMWRIWPTFPLNFLTQFSQKMRPYFFYTVVQKSKNGQ